MIGKITVAFRVHSVGFREDDADGHVEMYLARQRHNSLQIALDCSTAIQIDNRRHERDLHVRKAAMHDREAVQSAGLGETHGHKFSGKAPGTSMASLQIDL